MRAHALMPITSPIFARSSTAMAQSWLQGGPVIPISPFGAAHVAAALASLAGAAVVVIGAELRLPSTAVTIVGALLCFGVRFMAIRRAWRLPVAGAARDFGRP